MNMPGSEIKVGGVKRFGFIVAGCCGFACAIGFGLLLFGYLAGSARLQVIDRAIPLVGQPISSGSVMIGLIHVIGLATASLLCFAVGAVFCAHSIVREEPSGTGCASAAAVDINPLE